MLRPLKQSEFEMYVHFAYDLALDLSKSSYPTYCDGIKTKTDFIEQAKRAFDRKHEEILLFEYDRVVEGWIHYYAMPEDRYVSFFIFNIRKHVAVAVDEIIEYLAKNYHGCRLYFGLPTENEAVITHLRAIRFSKKEEHCVDVLHFHSHQSSDLVEGIVKITRKNFTVLAGLHDATDDDMYWNNLRLLAALENWNIYLLYENGSAVGAIYFGYVDDSVIEIYGTDYVHNRFSSEVFRKLLTHAMKEGKKAGMKHLVHFTGENEHPVAVQMGFRLVSRCELYSRDI